MEGKMEREGWEPSPICLGGLRDLSPPSLAHICRNSILIVQFHWGRKTCPGALGKTTLMLESFLDRTVTVTPFC